MGCMRWHGGGQTAASWLDKASDLLRTIRLVILVTFPAGAFAQNPFNLGEKDEIEFGRIAALEVEKSIRLTEDLVVGKYIGNLGE